MTFLHPLMLAALTLMAAPVLIHLLGRAFAKTTPWAAMMLLPAPGRGVTRWPAQSLLLLLSRMALLMLLVLAFAGPVRLGASLHCPQLTLILDTGPSMQLYDGGLPRIDRLKAAALAALATLQPGDRVAVYTAASSLPPTTDVQSAAQFVDQLSDTPDGLDLWVAVERSAPVPDAAPQQVCLIADLSGGQGSKALAELNRRPGGISPICCDVGNAGRNDLTLSRADVQSPRADASVVFNVTINNTASAARNDIALRWLVDNERYDDTVTAVGAGQTATALNHFDSLSPGQHLLSVTLLDTVASTRRRADVAVDIFAPPRITRLGSLHGAGVPLPWRDSFALASTLDSHSLDATDVLVIGSDAALADPTLDVLRRYIQRGGKLLILPTRALKPSMLTQLRAAGIGRRSASQASAKPAATDDVLADTAGQPQIIVCKSVPDADAFLSMLDRRWPRYRARDALRPGRPWTIEFPGPVDRQSAVVTLPDGQTDGLTIHRRPGRSELRYTQTTLSGAYRLAFKSNGAKVDFYGVVEPAEVSTAPAAIDATALTPVDQLPERLLRQRPALANAFPVLMAIALALLGVSALLEVHRRSA